MDVLPDFLKYFYCHASLLEELDINLVCTHAPVLDRALFDSDPPSLRQLRLRGVITHLPWKNLANLAIFNLKSCRLGRDFVTRLLDFLENTPLLRTIALKDSIPESSDAPPGRVVPLPHLDMLDITAGPAHSILLNHLCIPHRGTIDFGVHNHGDMRKVSDVDGGFWEVVWKRRFFTTEEPPLQCDTEVCMNG